MNAYEIITLACKGNKDAENFCKAWVEFCHMLDDCVDRDKPLSPGAVARAFTAYTLELAGNPFFQVNKGVLVGLMVQSANYWVVSHDRSPTERDITKCFWHSVIYEVAHLVGGWEHMAEVTGKTLEFDYEAPAAIAPIVRDDLSPCRGCGKPILGDSLKFNGDGFHHLCWEKQYAQYR